MWWLKIMTSMDMNLNPLPPDLSDFHFRILYGYGRVPDDWKRVLHAFDDINFVKGLFQFFENDSDELLLLLLLLQKIKIKIKIQIKDLRLQQQIL